eukprot:PhF_6_TR10975/c0_g1_i1/m.17717
MEVYHTNAFTKTPFKGNPATVCIPTTQAWKSLTDSQLQHLASELCKVEVVYVLPTPPHIRGTKSHADFHLRFYTQKQEMTFCGHATLAAAHILFSTNRVQNGSDIVSFSTQKNEAVVCTRRKDGSIEMELAPTPVVVDNTYLPQALPVLKESLALDPSCIAEIIPPTNATKNLIFVLKTREDVERAKLDPLKMKALAPAGVQKVTITARKTNTPNGEFVTRLFAPWIDIPEDAVSAATNAILALYWSREDRKMDVTVSQLSHRPGEIKMVVRPSRKSVGVAGDVTVITQGLVIVGASHL